VFDVEVPTDCVLLTSPALINKDSSYEAVVLVTLKYNTETDKEIAIAVSRHHLNFLPNLLLALIC
jgi:hypothetical protein